MGAYTGNYCEDWGVIWLQQNPIHKCSSLMLLHCRGWGVNDCSACPVYLCSKIQTKKIHSQVRKNCILFVVSCKLLIFFFSNQGCLKHCLCFFIGSDQIKGNQISIICLRLFLTFKLISSAMLILLLGCL